MPGHPMAVVLSIAGSDSSGGAGLQADLKTFEAHGVYGTTAVTAVTAQNTLGVTELFLLAPGLVRAQLEAIWADLPPQAIKIGMLGGAGIIREVATFLCRPELKGVPVVVDPVMVAGSGAALLEPSAVEVLIKELLPLATLITPNIPEAAQLTGLSLETLDDVPAAARLLGRQYLGTAVLIKGGHLPSIDDELTDVLWQGGKLTYYTTPYLESSKGWHGTGCTLASAITARLALGHTLPEAVALAKSYVQAALMASPEGLGRGQQLLRHNVPVRQ